MMCLDGQSEFEKKYNCVVKRTTWEQNNHFTNFKIVHFLYINKTILTTILK